MSIVVPETVPGASFMVMPRGGRGRHGLPRQTWAEAAYNVLSNPLPLDLAVVVAHLCAWAVSIAAAAVSDELSTVVGTAVAPLMGAWAGPAAPAPGVVARAVAQQLKRGLQALLQLAARQLSCCGCSLLASGRLVQLMVMACAVQCVGAVDPGGDDDAGAAAAFAVTLTTLASVVAGAVTAVLCAPQPGPADALGGGEVKRFGNDSRGMCVIEPPVRTNACVRACVHVLA